MAAKLESIPPRSSGPEPAGLLVATPWVYAGRGRAGAVGGRERHGTALASRNLCRQARAQPRRLASGC